MMHDDTPHEPTGVVAADSLRLPTRLLHLASWLLVQRAVNEGEMSPPQAATEQNKVRLSAQEMASGPNVFDQLPSQLRELTDRSLRLQARLLYLDRSIRAGTDAPAPLPPVADSDIERIAPAGPRAQWDQLRLAFAGRP